MTPCPISNDQRMTSDIPGFRVGRGRYSSTKRIALTCEGAGSLTCRSDINSSGQDSFTNRYVAGVAVAAEFTHREVVARDDFPGHLHPMTHVSRRFVDNLDGCQLLICEWVSSHDPMKVVR